MNKEWPTCHGRDYAADYYNARWWVSHKAQLLGGYATNALRSYVFPLYTPQGMLAIQEAPPDHPHHQGVWVGLEIDSHDMWNAGSFNRPGHRQIPQPELKTLTPRVAADGVTFAHQVEWRSVTGELLLGEARQVRFQAMPDVTQVEWRSTFFHPARLLVAHTPARNTVTLGQTKEAGIGVRVPPHWESKFGGQIRNAAGDVGEAGCFDRESPWLNVEGRALGDQMAGIVLAPGVFSGPHAAANMGMKAYPWFTRGYGCHIYNPARHATFTLEAGQELTWAVQVLAYDGHRSIQEISELVATGGITTAKDES